MSNGAPRISDLETPALVIDLDIMDRNLQRVADYTREHAIRLRPHTKTHKIPALARKQLELGAVGVTVAKVSEAEVMLRSETPDLLVAYPTVGQSKLARLMDVVKRTQVTVALDSVEAARQLSQAARAANCEVGVLAELDAGLGRVGVDPGEPIVALAKQIAALPGLRFDGLAFYPGHIKTMDAAAEKTLEALGQMLESVVEALTRAGLRPNIISGGSTPTLFASHRVACLNEVRPGTYIFNDRNTVQCGVCSFDDCAATILVTVVSTARPGQVIIDGGSKTFSSDRPNAGEVSFGELIDAPGAVFTKMNEEHGFIDVSRGDRKFAIGEQIRVIPNHICVAMNLHEQVYGVRNGVVEEIWKVEGRGKLQ